MQLHLHSYGTYLHVKDALFEIKIPQEGKPAAKHHFSAKKVTSFWLSKGTALSTAAVQLAMQHHIDIVFLEHHGQPMGRVWHSKLGSTTLIRKRQLEASMDERAVFWMQQWLTKKLDNQLEFVQSLGKHRKTQREQLHDTAERIAAMAHKISHLKAEKISEIAEQLRGWEGTAGRLYFQALSSVLPEAHQFSGRSHRPAQDAFNAFLNYGYGILYSRIEKAMMLAGIDPFLGFLHRDDYNHKSMVFDFIEPFRCFIDKPIFQLFSSKKVKQTHTFALTNGVGLTKEGKVLCVEAVNQYLDGEKIRYRNRNQTRATCMQSEAHFFANSLIGKADTKLEITQL